MKSFFYTTASIAFLNLIFIPVRTLAQTDTRDFKGEVGNITDFLTNLVVPLLVSVALLLFFWGLAQYILQAGDEQQAEAGRQRMMWGVVGLFAITAIWGLIQLLGGGLNLL